MVKSKNRRKTFKDTALHETAKEEEEEDANMPVFFYMPDVKPYGVLCQWHISPLTIPLRSLAFLKRGHMSVQDWIASIKTLWTSLPQPLRSDNPKALHFTCAEQAHMLCKALFFSDFPTATRIMLAPHPREQKKLAKEIEADQVAVEEWHAIGQEVAEMVNYAKFTQQGRLKASEPDVPPLCPSETVKGSLVKEYGDRSKQPLEHSLQIHTSPRLTSSDLAEVRGTVMAF
ncbi:hypothetical protein EG328_007511 [Venturia inaequalis]|uniref:NADAR domain-containing protein n=1 Tax=Venturia inaequalis TaxID=5025 RepID=A0A8H3UE60_VENIN|nr:hypothetical protein EG328_007511 [Venturia inaequalis]